MFRPVVFLSISLGLQISALAGSPVNYAPIPKTQTIITVSQNGTISVNQVRTPLKQLVAALNKRGVTADSKIIVQGEARANLKDITRVLETLSVNGFLPKDAID